MLVLPVEEQSLLFRVCFYVGIALLLLDVTVPWYIGRRVRLILPPTYQLLPRAPPPAQRNASFQRRKLRLEKKMERLEKEIACRNVPKDTSALNTSIEHEQRVQPPENTATISDDGKIVIGMGHTPKRISFPISSEENREVRIEPGATLIATIAHDFTPCQYANATNAQPKTSLYEDMEDTPVMPWRLPSYVRKDQERFPQKSISGSELSTSQGQDLALNTSVIRNRSTQVAVKSGVKYCNSAPLTLSSSFFVSAEKSVPLVQLQPHPSSRKSPTSQLKRSYHQAFGIKKSFESLPLSSPKPPLYPRQGYGKSVPAAAAAVRITTNQGSVRSPTTPITCAPQLKYVKLYRTMNSNPTWAS